MLGTFTASYPHQKEPVASGGIKIMCSSHPAEMAWMEQIREPLPHTTPEQLTAHFLLGL